MTEKTTIIETITNNPGQYLVSAVSGAGKTHLLVNFAKSFPHTSGLYLAYNKSIATEASRKFPSTTSCLTTHAMAYRAIVKANKLKIGHFSYRDIEERLSYDVRCSIVNDIREFCLSKYTSFDTFSVEEGRTPGTLHIAKKYLSLMASGKINCTHELYLKLFHIQLSEGHLEYDSFDFIMLDEIGDINEVTLEIFKLLPSTRKIGVGDPHQNIYSFNHTINCFSILTDWKQFTLPQSYRVSTHIAERVERFCQRYLDPDMEFKGIEHDDPTIVTTGYLFRTNGALISKMMELNSKGVPYSLVRKATEIFRIPLMLMNIKPNSSISDPVYKHLQEDYDDWFKSNKLKTGFKSPIIYFMDLYPDDIQLCQACTLLLSKGTQAVRDTYYEAKKHEKGTHPITLATSHSSKG